MAALYKIVFGNNVYNELFLPMYDIGTDDIPECCDIEIDISRNYVSIILVATVCPDKLFFNKYYIKHCPRTIFDKKYMEVTMRIPEIYFKDAEHILNKKFNSISEELKQKIKTRLPIHYSRFIAQNLFFGSLK